MTKKYLAAVLVTLLCPLLLLLWVAVSLEEARLGRTMKLQLIGKTAELDRQLTQFAVVPRLLASNPQVVESLSVNNSESLAVANVALKSAQIESNASFIFVMDKQGNTVASSNYLSEVSFVGVNYGFRPYFKEAISNGTATFFAVGATTGIPGYFVARPVINKTEVVGVIVAKFELSGLLDSWELWPYEWLAVDEFGVVILSTANKLLYTPTQKLSDTSYLSIADDRRYVLSGNTEFRSINPSRSLFIDQSDKQSFFVQRRGVTAEDWELLLIVVRSVIWARALLYLGALLALAALVALVYRNIRTQKRLAVTERKHAMELEHQVAERTEELRSAQEALISESNFAMLGRMSASINHEINQPLASLRLNLASLRRMIEMPTPDMIEVKQAVIDSDRTTKRIGRVVTTLRNLTSPKESVRHRINVELLIADVVETIKRERPAMYQYLHVALTPHATMPMGLFCIGNEVLLQQALLNLLYNAFDAVIEEENPSVQLLVENQSGLITIEVTDNGCGVSDSVVKNLFKPFVSDNARNSGLGLGLTLAEIIAKEHNGSLDYSPATNHLGGSIFTLTLPSLHYSRR